MRKGKHLQIYNIGTSEKITIKNLAKNIAKLLKIKISIQRTKLRKGGTTKRLPDISKITKLGFKRKFNLKNGLKKTLQFYY